jgi:hypothetical protein
MSRNAAGAFSLEQDRLQGTSEGHDWVDCGTMSFYIVSFLPF